MTIHIQGPWRTDATGGFPLDIHDQDNVLVARVQPSPAAHNVARRIVACVNACEGISTADIEKYPSEKAIHDAIADLVGQRDQLMAALERIASFTRGQFMGPNDMALECVNVAIAAVAEAAQHG